MKSFFRFILKNKLYSAINMTGLAVSMAFGIIVLVFATKQFGISESVPGCRNKYAVYWNGYTMSPFGLAGELRGSIPEIRKITKFTSVEDGFIAETKDRKYHVSAMFADEEFFSMFNVTPIFGETEKINLADAVFISRKFADMIGCDGIMTDMSLRINENDYNIAGIVEDFNGGYLPYTDIIASLENNPMKQIFRNHPFNIVGHIITVMEVVPGTDIGALENKIWNLAKGKFDKIDLDISLGRMDEMYFDEENIYLNKGNRQMIRNMVFAGMALLISAVFSYINLTVVLLGKRAKEMSTRIMLGAGKRRILFKYISESAVFMSASFFLAVVVAAVITPSVNSLITSPERPLPASIEISDIFNFNYLAYAAGFIVVTAVLSGLLSATAVYGMSPVEITGGRMRRRSKMVLSKIFIIVQNVISVTMIALAILMETQMKHLLDYPVGCDYENIYYLHTDIENPTVLRERLNALSCVENTGKCFGLPGNLMTMSSYDKDGTLQTFHPFHCDTVTFNMLNFNVIEKFSEHSSNSVWMSESAMRISGLDKKPHEGTAGEIFNMPVCGTVSDFIINSASSKEKSDGGIIFIKNDIENGEFCIKTTGSRKNAAESITKEYEKYCMETWGVVKPAFINEYMTDYLAEKLEQERRSMRLMEIFMIISIIISFCSLTAISIYYGNLNIKSIALHKIYGASASQEILRNIRLYILLTVAADVVAVPLSAILCSRYLEEFTNRIDLHPWIFILTVILSFGVTVSAVIWQVLKSAGTNPAEAIKTE